MATPCCISANSALDSYEVGAAADIHPVPGYRLAPQNFVRKSENDKDLQKLLKQVDYWMNQAGVPEKQRVMEWASLEDIECVREQDETRE